MKEEKRLAVLYGYQVLDTEPEDAFDAITRLTASICDTPMAFITLIDEKRQWIKSAFGSESRECSREEAICNYTIESDQIFEVPDTLSDIRFSNYPTVSGDPKIRFYAGHPLISPEGERIGALCVADSKPNRLKDHQNEALALLAKEVVSHFELAKKNNLLTQKLKEANEFKQLFDNSSEIHCITDCKGKIEMINESVNRLLGYSAKSAIGKDIWDFCAEGERDRIFTKLSKQVSEGICNFHTESKVLNHNGDVRWFEWFNVLNDGKWLVNGRDITLRKAHEDSLKTLSIAVEKSLAGVIIRNSDSEIEWMNRASEKILGYCLAELKGKQIGNLLIGVHSDLEKYGYARNLVSAGQPYELEFLIYKKDGTPVWLFISNNPILDENGDLDRQVGVVVDITERKRAEEQLIKTREDALKLSKAKESFLSVMSHEMRTPLNAVIGISRILKEEDPLERQKSNLDNLEFSAQNLLILINDVLDFTKIETGNLELEIAPVEIRSLASKTIESLKFKTVEKNLIISYDIDPRVPDLILGDQTRLYQIFMNLIGNSVKFTDEGFIKLSLIAEEENEESITIRFTISDTGIGIPADRLKTIFDPYAQAESDTSRKYGGTGLGLTITKQLVALHNSTLDVTSVKGKGSNFSFAINFKKLQNQALPIYQKRDTQNALFGKVLIVDDNLLNRIIAKKTLEKWSITTEFAEDGLQALEKVKISDFDLVLMDINMPIMGGIESVKLIRALGGEKYKTLPIIALTGSILKSNEDIITNSGMNDYILKPFDPSTLYQKISPYLTSLAIT